MESTMKNLFRALLAAVLVTQAAQVHAQPAATQYPTKPIKLLVGVPPGGSTDSQARLLASWLQQSLGQPTIVDNRPGANTAVAADAVARSAPDGYTLLVTTEAFLTMPLLTKLNFDPFRDFTPVGTVGVNHFVMVVHPTSSIRTVKDLVAAAKARPGKMYYGSSGNAGPSHLGIEKFKMLTETDIVHVPYKGAGPALTDAIGGQYELSLWTPLAISAHVASGKLRALAVTGPRRSSVLPDVPTFAEAGFPGYDHRSWLSVYAPAGTPKLIVDRLNAEIRKMLDSAKVKETLQKQGIEPLASTPEEVTAAMRKETAEIAKLIKAANIKMD
jgi:tripartite-type tricarboxylate transporter receptor subunit TctC